MKTSVAAILSLWLCGGGVALAAEPADPAKNLESVRKAVVTLQAQLDELGKAIAERDKAKETATAASLAEVAELRAEIEAIRQGMTEQRKAMDQAQADAQRLDADNKGLRAKLDQATKERDEAAKARDEVAKARDAAMKASGDSAKALGEASASSKAAVARGEENDRLQSELARSRQQIKELELQVEALAAGKVREAERAGARVAANVEAPPAAAAAPAPAATGATLVGGIKQWRQPDGTLFFGENPPIAGSKLITVIGGAAPAAPSAASPSAPALGTASP